MAKRDEFKKGDKIRDCIFIEDVEPHIHPSGEKRRRSKFICKCGKEFITFLTYIKTGQSRSCGCANREWTRIRPSKTRSTFGFWGTPEYSAWNALINRCYNPKDKRYNIYGAKGITVCEAWRNSFMEFLNDMGKRPSAEHSIDRVDPAGNYCKDNCRWATDKEQCRNRTNSIHVTYNNETKALSEWAEVVGIQYKVLYQRIHRDKLSIEEALTKPIKR